MKPGVPLTTDNRSAVVLFAVGAEGGSWSLLGRKDGMGTPQFSCAECSGGIDESWPAVRSGTTWTYDWQEALVNFDKYCWWMLYPLQVHPEFANSIWLAYLERLIGQQAASRNPTAGPSFHRWCELFRREPWREAPPE